MNDDISRMRHLAGLSSVDAAASIGDFAGHIADQVDTEIERLMTLGDTSSASFVITHALETYREVLTLLQGIGAGRRID